MFHVSCSFIVFLVVWNRFSSEPTRSGLCVVLLVSLVCGSACVCLRFCGSARPVLVLALTLTDRVLPPAVAARRLPVRPAGPWLAQLVRLPVLRGGGALVPGGLPHLLPHAPVQGAGEDALHQLAAGGETLLLLPSDLGVSDRKWCGASGRCSVEKQPDAGVSCSDAGNTSWTRFQFQDSF